MHFLGNNIFKKNLTFTILLLGCRPVLLALVNFSTYSQFGDSKTIESQLYHEKTYFFSPFVFYVNKLFWPKPGNR